MQSKKLDLNEQRKVVLIIALQEIAAVMDIYMRRIYDATRVEVEQAGGRILLNGAQLQITKYALEQYIKGHPTDLNAIGMFNQLNMTRREYQAYIAEVDVLVKPKEQ